MVKYNLILDVFTTYPLYSDIDVDKTKILRAHTKRFTGLNYSNVSFDLTNKYLTTGEPIDDLFAKIKTEEIERNFKNICSPTIEKATGSDTLTAAETLIHNAINNLCWLYIFKHKDEGGGASDNILFFAPYSNNKDNSINNMNITYYVSQDGNPANFKQIDASALYNESKNNQYVYNAFISPLGPFGSYDGAYNNLYYYYDSTQPTSLQIIFKNINVRNYQSLDKQTLDSETFTYDATYSLNGIFYTITSSLDSFISYFETADITAFEKDNITLSNTPYSLTAINNAEIKTMIRQNYNEFILKCDLDTSTLSIDLSILKTNTIKIKAINNIAFYTNGEIYVTANNLYEKDLGIFTRAQYTPIMYGDKFQQFKATNQNYKITSQAIPIFAGAAAGAVSGAKFGGGYGAAVGAVVGFGASALKVHTNFDNMKNSPNSIKLKGQSIAIDNKVKKRFFNLEHYTLRDADMAQANLYFYEFGYSINEIEEIKNFLNRSSFNYIQLNDDCEKSLHALLNENILNIVCNALKNVVRFWKKSHYIIDKFNYTTNNLETL